MLVIFIFSNYIMKFLKNQIKFLLSNLSSTLFLHLCCNKTNILQICHNIDYFCFSPINSLQARSVGPNSTFLIYKYCAVYLHGN